MNRKLLNYRFKKGTVLFVAWFAIGLMTLIPLFWENAVGASSSLGKVMVTWVSPPPRGNPAQSGVRYGGNPAQVGNTLEKPWQVLTLLRNSSSGVRMQSYRPRTRSYTFRANSGNRSVNFFYPCGGTGEFLLAWSEGGAGACAHPGFWAGTTRGETIGRASTTTIAQANKDLLKAQNSWGDFLQEMAGKMKVAYCSYVEDDGGAWSAKSAIAGTRDPCKQAQAQCLNKASAGSECFVASAGEWQLTNKDLVFSLDCADNRSFKVTRSGRVILAALVLQIEDIAQRIGGKACVLNIFPAGDMLIAPATDQLTIVQIRDLGARIAVDALRGNVAIRGAETPQGAPLILEEGKTYFGGSYDGEYYGGRSEQSNLTAVWSTPVIQEALAAEDTVQPGSSISPEIAKEMTAQQQALRNALRQARNAQLPPR